MTSMISAGLFEPAGALLGASNATMCVPSSTASDSAVTPEIKVVIGFTPVRSILTMVLLIVETYASVPMTTRSPRAWLAPGPATDGVSAPVTRSTMFRRVPAVQYRRAILREAERVVRTDRRVDQRALSGGRVEGVEPAGRTDAEPAAVGRLGNVEITRQAGARSRCVRLWPRRSRPAYRPRRCCSRWSNWPRRRRSSSNSRSRRR